MRGVAPCHNHINTAGHRTASGHQSRGANEQASSAPAPAARAQRTRVDDRSSTSPRANPMPGESFGVTALRASRMVSVTAAARRSLMGSGLAARRPLFWRYDVLWRYYAQCVDTSAVGARHSELESIDGRGVASTGQATELLHQQPRDGIEALLFGEVRAKILVEFFDAGDATHRELTLGLLADVVIVLDIELIVDIAHDLLDDILDRHQAGHTAVLVHHERHVVTVATEFLQQDVEPLGLWDEDHRPHVLTDVETLARLARIQTQQVLGEENADNVVAVLVHHRKARVARLDHHRQEFRERIVAADKHHLRAGDHDVAHLKVADL